MENLEQNLLEFMADFLDDHNTIMEMNQLDLEDDEDMHIKMRDAAIKVFKDHYKLY